ncbi:excalibur calcium-binding domain-containing protein [Streptomyces sp. NPDC101178]|uniref:excalibur calcium-binding domain-containing protein n=1 Tax=Streptomyces sp. NPDC101178 TaxID=3366124 RepID=UPI0037F58CFF
MGVVGIVGAGACAGGGTDGGATPVSTSVAAPASTSPASSAPAEVTATVTSTVTASPEKTAPSPERSAPPPAPSTTSTLSAEATVAAYFDAINSRDYREAWELGGKNLGGGYRAFVDGLAGTERETVRILGVEGDSVRVELEALQTDGSVKVFEGTYTVRSGVITDAGVREVTEPEDGTAPPGEETGGVYYENCDAARDAGVAPLKSGDPGYGDHLDRDGDGTACEPYVPLP